MGDAKAISNITISLNLLRIPAQLFSASRVREIGLRQLHTVCNAPLGQRLYCGTCQTWVAREAIKKGIEQRDGYVTIDPAALRIEGSEAEVVAAIPSSKLSDMGLWFSGQNYFIGPDPKRSHLLFAALMEALGDGKTALVVRFALRGVRTYGTLYIRDGHLVLQCLLFQGELRDGSGLPRLDPVTQPAHHKQRINAVRKVIGRLPKRLGLEELIDERVGLLEKLIPNAPKVAQPDNLEELLRQSLKVGKKKR